MKILIVDDHALVRAGLRQVLSALDDALEVLDAADCTRAFDLARQHTDLALVLLDYHLPGMNGQEALEIFRAQRPDLPIIMLSGSINPLLKRQVLNQGAAAFLTKSGNSGELILAIRSILAGDLYTPSESRSTQQDNPLTPVQEQPSSPNFTRRQEEVLQLLLDGFSNKEIGKVLSLSDETIKNHVTIILRRLEVSNRTQAAGEASRFGYFKSSSTASVKL